MSIEVRHDAPTMGFADLLLYELADDQRRRREQERALQRLAEQQAMQQPAPQFAPQAPAPEAQVLDAPQAIPPLPAGGSANRSGGRSAGGGLQPLVPGLLTGGSGDDDRGMASLLNKLIDDRRYRDISDAQLQQDLQERQLQEQGSMERAQYSSAAQLNRQLINEQPPPDILEGLRNGTLRYTPEQKTKLRQLEQSIATRDPAMTPAQWEQFVAQQREEIWNLKLNPEQTPWDELPVPMEDQFYQESPEVQDANGRKFRVTRDRNGTWRVVDPPADDSVKAELDRQKFEQQIQQKEQDFHVKAVQREQENQAKAQKSEIDIAAMMRKSEQALLDGMRDAELKSIYELAPQREDYKGADTADGKPGKFKQAEFDAAVQEYRNKLQAVNDKYRPQYEDLYNRYKPAARIPEQTMPAPPPMGTPEMGGAPQPTLDGTAPPSDSGQKPIWETMLPWADYYDKNPMGKFFDDEQGQVVEVAVVPGDGVHVNRYYPVASREDLEALPKGVRFILPDGRTGTRQ